MPSTPVTRASLAPPAAVGGDPFGPTSSVAVSQHGHGHHLVTQYLQGAQLLGESQCQLAGETGATLQPWIIVVRDFPWRPGRLSRRATQAVMSATNYNKWDKLDLDDDEDVSDCHPNIDGKLWLR